MDKITIELTKEEAEGLFWEVANEWSKTMGIYETIYGQLQPMFFPIENGEEN